MVKYASNAFHALKITFANEMGNLCKALGLDGQEVMEIFCKDRRLNISPSYLSPGFAFGGSCLPKDVRALLYRAKQLDVDCSVLSAILPSNQKQVELGIRLVENAGVKKVGILGLSFKADTDDLRESPAVILAETLLGRGYRVKIFDERVQLSQLLGSNKSFLERELPHIASLMCSSVEDLASQSEVVIITNQSKSFEKISGSLNGTQKLIDLVGLAKNCIPSTRYEGMCW
jgi:GDP-mannose 6-dehydrogenase